MRRVVHEGDEVARCRRIEAQREHPLGFGLRHGEQGQRRLVGGGRQRADAERLGRSFDGALPCHASAGPHFHVEPRVIRGGSAQHRVSGHDDEVRRDEPAAAEGLWCGGIARHRDPHHGRCRQAEAVDEPVDADEAITQEDGHGLQADQNALKFIVNAPQPRLRGLRRRGARPPSRRCRSRAGEPSPRRVA